MFRSLKSPIASSALVFAALSVGGLSLTGCGTGGSNGSNSPTNPVSLVKAQGIVFGGQQPVKGSNIVLYAASTTGATSISRMTQPVKTDAAGNFTITSNYACQSGDEVYIVATGGDSGSGANDAIAMMTALGPCSSLLNTTFIEINEVTTVASVYSLANYITSPTGVGPNGGSLNGLYAAFATTQTFVDTTTGIAPLTTTGNGIVPQSALNSLANSLAACVNSANGSACTRLFMDAKVGDTTPTDTLQAAINIAHNPAQNATDIYNLAIAAAPFQPSLTSAPATFALAVQHPSDVLTYHNDISRSGVQPYELALNTTNVNSTTFGKKYTFTVDGQVYAQPLYVGGYGMPDGQVHNLVLVATAHGTVYAFDADNNNPTAGYLWKQSLFASGETTVGPADYNNCQDTTPEAALMGTPVIDRSTGTLYVVTNEKLTGPPVSYSQKIHAINLVDGTEKFNGPTVITATGFAPIQELQRPALLLSSGTVWITWASHCDIQPYNGFVMGYNAADVSKQTVVYNDTTTGTEGGIWMSGQGPAADAAGNVYVATGNGTFDYDTGGPNLSQATVKLQLPTSGTTPVIADYFSPSNEATLSNGDQDFGTSGVLLFNDPASSFAPTVVVTTGKNSTIYAMNTAPGKMGGYNASNDNAILSEFSSGGQSLNSIAYFNGTLYTGMSSVGMKAYAYNSGDSSKGGTFSTTPSSQASNPAYTQTYARGGMAPVISANGVKNGIVWGWEHSQNDLLHAYDASNLATELYNSGQAASSRDAAPTPVKFQTPTVANGLVILGGSGTVAVYGLLP
jgi:hypothetical protein